MSDGLMMEDRASPPETSFPGAQEPRGGPSQFLAPNTPDTSGPGPVSLQEPAAWIYDFDPATGMSRATFNGVVSFSEGGGPGAGVTSWNGQTGAVVMEASDLTAAGGLVNPSVALTGTPTAPTASPGTSSTQLATTQFVAQAIVAGAGVTTFNGRTGAITLTSGDVTGAGGAPTVSPALTGTPTAPTAAQGDASSQIATTQFVDNAIASGTVTSFNGRRGAVALSLSDVESVGGAPIASPNFTGAPSGPTASPGTATTQLATTAFVTDAITAGTAGVSSVNTRTGAVVLNASDLAGMGGAPLNSPTFAGNPAAPTPSAGDNSTRIATTAYVETAIGGLPPGVATFNGRQGTVTLQLTDVTSVGGAPLASPTFTGSPLTTTPPPGDNSTRIADTAFVAAAIAPVSAAIPAPSNTTPFMNGTGAAGSAATWSRGDHVHPSDMSRLALTGGTLTGQLNVQSNVVATGDLVAGQGGAQGNLQIQGGWITYTPGAQTFVMQATSSGGSVGLSLAGGTMSANHYVGDGDGWGPAAVIQIGGVGGSHSLSFEWTSGVLYGHIDATAGFPIYPQASDYRIKKDVAPLHRTWETVKSLNPIRYTRAEYGPFEADDIERWGFLAHELQAAMTPGVSTGFKDAPDHIQTPDPMAVIAALTKTLQEAMTRIEALENSLMAPAWRG